MYPTLEQVEAFAATGEYKRVPIYGEFLADRYTPVQIVRILRNASCHCFLLESADHNHRWSRYSFMGCNPTMEITLQDGTLKVTEGEEGMGPNVTVKEVDHPGEELRKILARYKSPEVEGMPPLSGGLVGYFSYDYFKYAEPCLKEAKLEDCGFRDMDLMLFDQIIVYDYDEQKLKVVAGVMLDDPDGVEAAYGKASAKIDDMIALLDRGDMIDFEPLHIDGKLAPRLSKDEYCQMVETARHYIYEGDIFQVVLSNPMSAPATGSLFDTYRMLRTTNPSPYMFYFSSDDVELAGSSPETLVNLQQGVLHTFPLAGTRPRGATPEEDAANEESLLADEKELAEHNMLVDLGRNDIGRISKVGTVEVEEYLQIHRYSHVMHIGSTVRGEIRDGYDAIDAIDSILPAGTLSGAPKVRACQIIQELEGCTRGVYGGAVGYLDFAGNMDTCIGIRMAYMKNGQVCVQAGAGIVADSVPENEYQECLNKAKAVQKALEASEGGLR